MYFGVRLSEICWLVQYYDFLLWTHYELSIILYQHANKGKNLAYSVWMSEAQKPKTFRIATFYAQKKSGQIRREIHFSLVILVATRIAGLALTSRIEEILGGFILTRLLQFLSNSEKCVSCRDKMYVHVQQCSIGWRWQGHGNVLFYDCIGRKAMFHEEGELLQHIATCDHTY